jgi:hypothetical protein
MNDQPTPTERTRTILLLTGLFDCTAGAVLLLIWIGLLPVDLARFGIEKWMAGVVGAALFIPGFLMILFQLLKSQIE